MDTKQKARWVEALRSGKFKQTTGMLSRYRDKSYCCLGVICALNPAAPEATYAYGRLRNWGIDQDTENKLIDMNDNGMSFDQIADYIEKNL